MAPEPRVYAILVCPECGALVDRDRDCPNYHLVSPVEVMIVAEWDRDPLKYGLDRAGLTIRPQATIVPPPIGTARTIRKSH